MEVIQAFIFKFSIVPVVVAAGIGAVRYRRLDAIQRYLAVLSFCALAIEIIARSLMYLKRSNLFLAPIDTVLEFSLLMLMYRLALRPSVASRFVPVLLVGFVLGSALSYSLQLNTVEFNPVQRFIESICVLTFVLLFFRREILRKKVTVALERLPIFWASAGLLLYFSGSILIFLSSNAVLHYSQAMSVSVWAIHALLYTFLNIFYAIALSLNTQRPYPAQH